MKTNEFVSEAMELGFKCSIRTSADDSHYVYLTDTETGINHAAVSEYAYSLTIFDYPNYYKLDNVRRESLACLLLKYVGTPVEYRENDVPRYYVKLLDNDLGYLASCDGNLIVSHREDSLEHKTQFTEAEITAMSFGGLYWEFARDISEEED
ncbi:MAG: hypothetical protein ACK5NA_01560 [Enterococcus sp.]